MPLTAQQLNLRPLTPQRELAYQAYVECALWSSTGDDDLPLDGRLGEPDLDPGTRLRMRLDVQTLFDSTVTPQYEAILSEPKQAGVDLWLTRNGHGAGFWDGGWGEHGEWLTALVKKLFPPVELYVGDDGKVHSTHP